MQRSAVLESLSVSPTTRLQSAGRFEIASGGFADNISFFVNVTFPTAGRYVVQTLIDSNLYQEQILTVSDVTEAELLGTSEAVN